MRIVHFSRIAKIFIVFTISDAINVDAQRYFYSSYSPLLKFANGITTKLSMTFGEVDEALGVSRNEVSCDPAIGSLASGCLFLTRVSKTIRISNVYPKRTLNLLGMMLFGTRFS